MPSVSCLLATFRPGLDITFAGMRDQTFRDFELVICDRRYERRHAQVLAVAEEYGVQVIHVPEHRRNGKWTSFCLHPDQAVVTWNGMRPISSIREDDRVLTHRGNFRKVIKTLRRSYSGRMISIRCHGYPDPVRLTPEHPVLTAKLQHYQRDSRTGTMVEKFEWKEAGKISVGDALVLPKPSEYPMIGPLYIGAYQGNNHIRITEIASAEGSRLSSLIGWYLAEGHVAVNQQKDRSCWQIIFSLGSKEESLAQKIREHLLYFGMSPFTVKWKAQSALRVGVASKALALFLKDQFGSGAGDKKVPGWVYGLDRERCANILDAYLAGDGYVVKSPYYCDRYNKATTVSRALADGIRLLAIKLDCVATLQAAGKGRDTIQGRKVTVRDRFIVPVNPRGEKTGNRVWQDEKHLYSIVKQVGSERYQGEVCNLSVEEDETYCTPVGVVHNCSGWNTAAAVARGDVLIFLQDWAYCPPGWIEAHLNKHEVGGRYVAAPYIYTEAPPVRLPAGRDRETEWGRGDSCTDTDRRLEAPLEGEVFPFQWGRFSRDWLEKLPPLQPPHQDSRVWPAGPGLPDTYFHIKNESIHRHLFYNLNGLDERMDRGKGPMDLEFGVRIFEAAVELWWEPEGLHICPNPRGVVRTMPWGDKEQRLEGRWSYRDGESYVARRRIEARNGNARALNPYDLYDLAAKLEGWRTTAEIDVSSLDVSDQDYWGREIWPETP